jgi:peptidoglycan/LPS O-acetylase OafA/YrhL
VVQIIIGACVFSIILRLTLMGLHVEPENIYRNTFARMDSLLLGAACAFVLRNESLIKYIHRHAIWFWIGPLVTLAVLRAFFQPFHNTTPAVQGLGYTAIALSYAALLLVVVVRMGDESLPQRVLASGVMRGFGKYSYAAYIWHPLVRKLVERYELQALHTLPPALVNLPLMIAATLAVSVCSYVVVERPFLLLRRYFEPRKTHDLSPQTVTSSS